MHSPLRRREVMKKTLRLWGRAGHGRLGQLRRSLCHSVRKEGVVRQGKSVSEGQQGPITAYSPDSDKRAALYLHLTPSRMVKEPLRKLRGVLQVTPSWSHQVKGDTYRTSWVAGWTPTVEPTGPQTCPATPQQISLFLPLTPSSLPPPTLFHFPFLQLLSSILFPLLPYPPSFPPSLHPECMGTLCSSYTQDAVMRKNKLWPFVKLTYRQGKLFNNGRIREWGMREWKNEE